MIEQKCELCGTPVKVVGKTTKYYEPIRQPVRVPSEIEIMAAINKAGFNLGSVKGLAIAREIIALLTEGKGNSQRQEYKERLNVE